MTTVPWIAKGIADMTPDGVYTYERQFTKSFDSAFKWDLPALHEGIDTICKGIANNQYELLKLGKNSLKRAIYDWYYNNHWQRVMQSDPEITGIQTYHYMPIYVHKYVYATLMHVSHALLSGDVKANAAAVAFIGGVIENSNQWRKIELLKSRPRKSLEAEKAKDAGLTSPMPPDFKALWPDFTAKPEATTLAIPTEVPAGSASAESPSSEPPAPSPSEAPSLERDCSDKAEPSVGDSPLISAIMTLASDAVTLSSQHGMPPSAERTLSDAVRSHGSIERALLQGVIYATHPDTSNPIERAVARQALQGLAILVAALHSRLLRGTKPPTSK